MRGNLAKQKLLEGRIDVNLWIENQAAVVPKAKPMRLSMVETPLRVSESRSAKVNFVASGKTRVAHSEMRHEVRDSKDMQDVHGEKDAEEQQRGNRQDN